MFTGVKIYFLYSPFSDKEFCPLELEQMRRADTCLGILLALLTKLHYKTM